MAEVVRSAVRVLDMLEYFAGVDGWSTLAEVTAEFGMPKTSALALLRTLCARGYLERDDRGLYTLNELFRAQGFGWAGSRLARLLSVAEPVLNRLAERVGETTCIGALTSDGQVKILAQGVCTQAIRYEAQVGRTLPVHCTAMGRVLLAGRTVDERNSFLSKHPIGSYTDTTITDLTKIHYQMDLARDRGIGVVRDEYDTGGSGMAAPVHDKKGRILATINVACISARFESKKEAIELALREAAVELEQCAMREDAVAAADG